jgi:hypothetical protein
VTRRGVPDPDALGALAPGGLRRAPDVDPVLGAATAGSPQERAAPVVSTPPAPVVAPAVPPVAPGPAPAAVTARRRKKEQWHDWADELALLRAAYWHTAAREGHRSWSAFVADVMRRERARLETLYNGGRPWPPVESGELPTGRPLGG